MNPDPASTQRCPHCHSAIPEGAPAGLCPRCVLTGAATPTDAGSSGVNRANPPSLDEVAAAFPELEVVGLVGAGGMGCVYRVRMKSDGREAALKLLPKSLAADPAFLERFNREARTLSRLNHPNIVGVYGYGQSGGFCHLTMEFVDGANLRQAMRAGKFTAVQALEIVPRLCDALQYAHSQGVLHRDIKPENILLDGQGRVKIADFGIAKLVGDGTGHGADITLTQTGSRLGTPHYMAPEQIERPDDVDHRADIYSLGVVFYELLTGELPLGRFPAPSAKAYIDARVDAIVFRALAKERELRQQSAAQVGEEVAGLAHPAPEPKPTVLRRDSCFISNPSYLRSLWAQFYIYTGHGQLELTQDRLSFRGGRFSVDIPLRSISAISVGEYPRLTKPTGLNYIAVRFRREAGAAEEVLLFTPFRSAWNATWTTNAVVDEWHELLVDAWTRMHGRPPFAVSPGEGVLPAAGGGVPVSVAKTVALSAGLALAMGLLGLLIFMLLGEGITPLKSGMIAALVFGPILGVGLVMWVLRRFGHGFKPGRRLWIPAGLALLFALLGVFSFRDMDGPLLRLMPAISGCVAVVVLIVGGYRRRAGFVAGRTWRWLPLVLLGISVGTFTASLIADRKPTFSVQVRPAAEPADPGLTILKLIAKDLQPGRRIRLQTIYWSNGVPSLIPELETVFEPKELGAQGSQLAWSMEKGSLRFRRSDEDGVPQEFEAGPRMFLCEGKPEWNALNRQGRVWIEFRGRWKATRRPAFYRQLLFGDAVTRQERENTAGMLQGNAAVHYGIEARFEVVPQHPHFPTTASSLGSGIQPAQ